MNPKIVVGVPSSLPDYAASAESFQGTAKQAGLDVELKLLPEADSFALFSDSAARAKIDLFYTQWLAWIPDTTEPYKAIATANGVANYGGYKKHEVSSLLGQASSTVDAAKRAELVAKAQAVISTGLPWILVRRRRLPDAPAGQAPGRKHRRLADMAVHPLAGADGCRRLTRPGRRSTGAQPEPSHRRHRTHLRVAVRPRPRPQPSA